MVRWTFKVPPWQGTLARYLGKVVRGHLIWLLLLGMMPHTAGKTVAAAAAAMSRYFGQPVVNLREFPSDDAIPPLEMGVPVEKRL